MQRIRCFITLVALAATAAAAAPSVSSPDGTITVDLELSQQGRLRYAVSLRGQPALDPSPLGLETSLGSFSSGLTAAGEPTTTRIDEHYTLPHGKVRDVHYVANELTRSFTTASGHHLDVIFRVSDTDVAFA